MVQNRSILVPRRLQRGFIGFYSAGAMGGGSGPPPSSVYLGNVVTATNSLVTNHVLNLGSPPVGTLMIMQFVTGWGSTGGTASGPTGWTTFHDSVVGARRRFRYRIADGTEGSTATMTTTNATNSICIIHWIAPGEFNISQAPEIAVANGTSASPNPPSLSPSWGSANTIWLPTMFCREGIPGVTVVSYPAAGDPTTAASILGGGQDVRAASCWQQINTATLDPDAFSISESRAWMAQTVAIRPI